MPHTPSYNYGAPTSVGMPMYTMPNVSSPRHAMANRQASPLIQNQGTSAYGTSPNNPYGPGTTTAYNPAYQTGVKPTTAQPSMGSAPRNRANSESSDSDENK